MNDREVLGPAAASGLWITLVPKPARIFVTRDGKEAHAVLLDDWGDRLAFSLIDLNKAPYAEFAGEALMVPVTLHACLDAEDDEGRLILRGGECYLTCLDEDDVVVEILINERPPRLPEEEGDLGNAWELHFRYYHEFFAIGFECYYPMALKVDHERGQQSEAQRA